MYIKIARKAEIINFELELVGSRGSALLRTEPTNL